MEVKSLLLYNSSIEEYGAMPVRICIPAHAWSPVRYAFPQCPVFAQDYAAS